MLKEKWSRDNCPKCGYGEIQSETCIRCGLIFNRYDAVQERKRMLTQQKKKVYPSSGRRKNPLGIHGWASVVSVVLTIFIVSVVLGSGSFVNHRKSDSEKSALILKKVMAVKYDDARELVLKLYKSDDQRAVNWSQFIHEKEDLNLRLQKGKRDFTEGERLHRRRDYEGAAKKFEAALINFETQDDKRLIAATNLNLGINYRILLKNRDALKCFEAALNISRENAFKEHEAKALQGSGLLYNQLGQYEKALTYLDEALALHRDLNDKRGEAVDWVIKGIIESNRSTPGAGNSFRKALAISKEIGDPLIALRAGTLLNKWLDHLSEKASLRGRVSHTKNS